MSGMRYLAPILAAVTQLVCLTAARGQESKPFSHRIHLELKLECGYCHTTAAASTKAADNLLPPISVCRNCHDDARVVKPPRQLTVAKFNHSLHLQMGNLAPVILAAVRSGAYLAPHGPELEKQLEGASGCTACHRGLEQSDAVSLANFPAMADCLVCHSKLDPPYSCEKCHVPGPNLKPASHTAQFLESHSRQGALREKVSCAVCHGRDFTCLGCH